MIEKTLRFSWAKFRWQILNDMITVLILFVLSVYVVYFTSQEIAKLFFLLLLFIFFFSKKDYLWFAYFFIVAQGPGYFFSDFSGISLHRMPIYTLLPGMSFMPIDLFVFIALLKALDHGKKMNLRLKKPLFILLAYIIFSVAVSTFIYRTDVDVIAANSRWVFCYSIIISFLYLVNHKHDIYRFILLVFPFVFFNLFTQIYYVTFGDEFINLFDPGYRALALNTVTGEVRPLIGGGLITFFSYIFAFVLLTDRDYRLSKLYLYFVLAGAFLSVFLSATRLWFVIFSFILIGYMIVSTKKFLSTIGIFGIFFLVISTLIWSGLISSNFLIQGSWGRLQQVFNIAGGDIHTMDTAMNRMVNQLPILAAIIKQNLFLGYGFSYFTMFYYDNDFGFLNTILMFGVVGLSLFIFFFVRMFAMLVSTIKRIRVNNPFRISLNIMILLWAGILIGYFTTWDFFTMSFNKIFFVSVLIALAEFFVMEANKEELILQQEIQSQKSGHVVSI